MRDLTLVLPHFCNLGMLAEQQRVWADYPSAIRSRLHVIVVDDCSPYSQRPTERHIFVKGLGSLRLFHLLEKRRWNWLACRNLGAKMAGTAWILLTDIDHVVPVTTMERLIAGPLNESHVYRFGRRTATKTWPYTLEDCTDYKPHNDSWLLTRALFFDDRVGGYDERLSGCYGTSGEFKDRLVGAAAAHVHLVDSPLIRYPREIIGDASTHPSVYTRKNDPENDAELQRRKAMRKTIANWKPLHGLIPHAEVSVLQEVA